MQVRCWRPFESLFRCLSVVLLAAAVEYKGGSSNVASHRPCAMSSQSNLEAARTNAEYAVDGQYGTHVFLNGCAMTMREDSPWWRVDLGYRVPTFVVRIFGRSDALDDVVTEGVEVRVGDAETWDQATPCSTGIQIRLRLPTVVNCIGEGRYVFVGAPNAGLKMLALCEVEVLPRGPSGSQEWWGTTGRSFAITVKGKALDSQDRIRIVQPTQLCGEDETINMHTEVVERSSPSGPPTSVTTIMNGESEEAWEDVKILTLGYYKVCWCTGLSKTCAQGRDFPFNAGYVVITGELRTVVGIGMELRTSSGDAQGWEKMDEVDIGRTSGVALSDDGLKLFYSEPNRVRMVKLADGLVKTIAGSQSAGFSGDGGPATSAKLSEPTGVSACTEPDTANANGIVRGNEYVLVADTMNNRIRYINLASGNITTVVGNGNAAYVGNGDQNLNLLDASLKQPRGVACDPGRFGMWISDTGNNAVRLVHQGIIRTVAGVPPAKGKAAEGAWGETALLDSPQQIITASFGTDDVNVAFAEQGSVQATGDGDWISDPQGGGALARWMTVPTFTTNFGSSLNTIAGTGEQGYNLQQSNYLTDAELLQPEGVAMHNSLAFVSDTMNHRIWMVPVVEYRHLGCWNERKWGNKLIPLVEDNAAAGLTGTPGFTPARTSTRDKAVEQCAMAALRLGFTVFGLRNGGECATSAAAPTSYSLEGRYYACGKGIGSTDANDVYMLLPGTSLDLVGRMHAIIGRALTTVDNFFSERPRSGYVGDTKSSWISAVNEPAQLALDRITGNLYFADRGNFRIRVLFGQFGPRPFTQHFVCTNGRNCSIDVTGNGLYLKDSVGFLRKVSPTSTLLCGHDDFETQFNSNTTVADRNKAFLQKTFSLGKLSLHTVGDFKICYCVWEAEGRCEYKPNFDFIAGNLQITGPNVQQDVIVVAGAPFDLAVHGAGLTTKDRVRFVLASQECGVADDLAVVQPSYFASSLTGVRNEGSTTYEVWKGMVVKRSIDIAVCWCNLNGCIDAADFDVRMAALYVRGPVYAEIAVSTGTPFDLVLRGSGSFMVTNRVRLQDASIPCESNQSGPVAVLDAALPWQAVPCGISATSATWCAVTLHHPGELHVCWCGSTSRCTEPSDFNVLAAKLLVTGATVSSPASGPFYSAVTPRSTLGNVSAWPERMTANAMTITVNAHTRREVPDSGSPGPIHVSVCETATKCVPPAILQHLAPGSPVEGTSFATTDMLPLKPIGILVKSLSPDPWLVDSIDVAIGNSWRRFTINRWLVDLSYDSNANDGSNPWSVYTIPPRAMPVSNEIFTVGDNCGGCPVGWECRDGSASSADGTCHPVCGDGLPVDDEQCDDGNLQSLDGCDSQCRVEVGFDCTTEHEVRASVCRPRTCAGGIGLNEYDAVCNAMSNVTDINSAVACWLKDGPLCRASPSASAPWFPSLSAARSVWPGCSEPWMLDSLWLCGHVEVRPRAVLITPIEAGRGLVVAFDAPMEAAIGEVPCAMVFSTATISALGDQATCKWASQRHLIARLGFGASFGLVPGSSSVDILDTARQHLNASIPVLEPWKFPSQAAGLSKYMDIALEAMPVVVLRAPVVGSTCGDVNFDATGSRGSYGRQWKKVVWTCEGVHCSELLPHIPTACVADGSGDALAAGPTQCGLVLALPEAASGVLASKQATLTVKLELVNVLGLSAYGEHTISFTQSRVPVAVPLSDVSFTVPADANTPIEFELSARSAMPVSTFGLCQFSDSLGPIGVSWAYGAPPSDTSEPLATSWTNLQGVPATLSSSARVGLLSGSLGSLAQSGQAWMVLARVEHAPSSAGAQQPSPVYVRFNVQVAQTSMAVKLQVPRRISATCPLKATAVVTNASSAATFSWSCARTAFTSGTPTGHQLCSQAAQGVTGDTFFLSSIAVGVYLIEVEVSENSVTKKASAIVTVFADSGPPVRILQPSTTQSMGLSSTTDSRQFYFSATVQSLDLPNCVPNSLSAAVVVFGLIPHSAVPIIADSQVVLESFEFAAGLSEIQVNAQIPLASLSQGLSYKFQLLLSANGGTLAAHLQRIGSADPRDLPSSLTPPAGVWAYESLSFSQSLPLAFAFWVTPKTGTAARTLFQLQGRAICDGCVFSYRFASAKVEATDAMSCDVAKIDGSSWLLLRSWNSEAEARLPFLAGRFVVEARARSPNGGIERTCAIIDVASGGPSAALATSGGSGGASIVLNNWVADVSSTVNLLRSAGEPSATVLSLQAVASELPDMSSFQVTYGATATSQVKVPVRNLHENMCVTLVESVVQLDASYFISSSRRLASSRRLSAQHLEAVVDTILMSTQKLGPLISSAELSLSLQVLEALLGRNAAVRGLLGSPGIGNPTPVATNFFALCDLILSYGASLTKSGEFVPSAIAATAVSVAIQLGDVVGAALPRSASAAPFQVKPSNGQSVLWVQHLSGNELRVAGINVQIPVQQIVRPVYAGVKIPALGSQFSSVQSNLSASSAGACLGAGVSKPLDGVVLVTIAWTRDPQAIGRATGALPTGINMTAIYTVALRTCGRQVQVGGADLGGSTVDLVFELSPVLLNDLRWGYENSIPFQCMHWSSQWTATGCSSSFRGKGAAEIAKFGSSLPEGAIGCSCQALLPTTYGVEIVPRPVSVDPVEPNNTSFVNLTLYATIIVISLAILLLPTAALGDLALLLGSDDISERLGRVLMSTSPDLLGVQAEAAAYADSLGYWPLHSGLVEAIYLWWAIASNACCCCCCARSKGKRERLLEVTELERYGRDGIAKALEQKRSSVNSWEVPKDKIVPTMVTASGRGISAVPPRTKAAAQSKYAVQEEMTWNQPSTTAAFEKHEEPVVQPAVKATVPPINAFTKYQPAPLPEGWEAYRSEAHRGREYYVNVFNSQSTWMKPKQSALTQMSIEEIRFLLGNAAEGVNLRWELEAKLRARLAARQPEENNSRAVRGEDFYSDIGAAFLDTENGELPAARMMPEGRHQAPTPLVIHSGEQRLIGKLKRVGVDERLQEADTTTDVLSGALARSQGKATGSRVSPHRSNSHSPARLMPAAPRPTFMAEPIHQVAIPSNESVSSRANQQGTDGLRVAANVNMESEADSLVEGASEAPHSVRVSEALEDLAKPDQMLTIKLAFASWSLCKLLRHCWVRNCPLAAALLPSLVTTRTIRGMTFVFRLTLSLFLAVVISSSSSWDDRLDDDVDVDDRSSSDMWGDLSIAFSIPMVFPVGVLCRFIGGCLARLSIVPGPLRPIDAGFKEWLRWWRTCRTTMWRNSLGMLILALVFWVGILVVASISPQPRQAVAFAALMVILAIEIVLEPTVAAFVEAWILWRAGRKSNSCYGNFLVRFPYMMDFTHVQVSRWRSRNALLGYAEALLEERYACLSARANLVAKFPVPKSMHRAGTMSSIPTSYTSEATTPNPVNSSGPPVATPLYSSGD